MSIRNHIRNYIDDYFWGSHNTYIYVFIYMYVCNYLYIYVCILIDNYIKKAAKRKKKKKKLFDNSMLYMYVTSICVNTYVYILNLILYI